jgi:hypothetical protein
MDALFISLRIIHVGSAMMWFGGTIVSGRRSDRLTLG